MPVRKAFITTTRGLNRESLPMRLYEKSKRLGVWNPSDIDLTQDILDWEWFKPDERDMILRLAAMFQAGEEAVTLDLLPLIQVIAQEGRVEEEIFLTAFLFEEAKHTDFFNRFITQVARRPGDLTRYHSANYRAIFYDALPKAMQRLQENPSPRAQAEASVVYNMIVEGVLVETGYHVFLTALERNDLMPGCRKAIGLLKQDEARHLAYGVYLLARLIAANHGIWGRVEAKMSELLPVALGVIGDAFASYDPIPFGLVFADFVNFATTQFQKRIERLERARKQTEQEVEEDANAVMEQTETG